MKNFKIVLKISKLFWNHGSSFCSCSHTTCFVLIYWYCKSGLREYDHDGSKARNLERILGIKVIRHSEWCLFFF
jgi:hypothetical protein